jgi:hypothetical protein
LNSNKTWGIKSAISLLNIKILNKKITEHVGDKSGSISILEVRETHCQNVFYENILKYIKWKYVYL